MLSTTIPARAVEARAQRADTTPEIDRSRCPASRHGTASAKHNHGCTCPDSAAAKARMVKTRRHGRRPSLWRPALGTRRRIHALQALGWSASTMAERLGCSKTQVQLYCRQQVVHRSTELRVLALYEALRRSAPPETPAARRTRTVAAREGWPTPAQWADADLDDPAAVSDLPYQRTNTGPAGADAAWLASPDGGNLDHDQIAARLDTTPEHVELLIRGTAIAAAKAGTLTDDDVIAIRAAWVAGRHRRPEFAAQHGLTPPQLHDILTGRARRHLGLTDLIGDSAYRAGTRRGRTSPDHAPQQPADIAGRDRQQHDRVHRARRSAAPTGEPATLTDQAEHRDRESA